MIRSAILSLTILALFDLHRASGDEQGNQLPPEARQLWKKLQRQADLRGQAAAKEIQKVRRIETPIPDSLSLQGDELGNMRRHTYGEVPNSITLQNGTLYLEAGEDFGTRLLRFHFDAKHTYA